jgi:hypothetical protein
MHTKLDRLGILSIYKKITATIPPIHILPYVYELDHIDGQSKEDSVIVIT